MDGCGWVRGEEGNVRVCRGGGSGVRAFYVSAQFTLGNYLIPKKISESYFRRTCLSVIIASFVCVYYLRQIRGRCSRLCGWLHHYPHQTMSKKIWNI